MDLNLAGKTVIITGGGSNIGRAISFRFAEERANVVLADYDANQANKVADQIKNNGGEALVIQTDVRDNNQVVNMVQQATDSFGQVDILVNNVGGGAVDKLFIRQTREEWENVIAVTYWSVLNCTRAVLDQMIERKSGAIVSLGSDAGRMGEYNEAVYSGAKGGVIAFTKAVAREVGRYGIRLNVVCPGLTVPQDKEAIGEKSLWGGGMMDIFTSEAQAKAAKAYPLRKIGKAEEVADAVAFIASGCASHITGQTLSVSGGYTMM